jgi:hypothetical protein
LTGDIGISINSTLSSLKFQMLHLVLIQDGAGGHDVTSWDSAINGTPSIDTNPNSVTTVSLFSIDQGTTWFFVSSEGGVLGSGAVGALNDLSDVTIVGPTAGEYLRYGGAVWSESQILWPDINMTGSSLDDLDDTLIGTPSANTVLKWSGTAWVDGNIVDANIDAGAAIALSKINIGGIADGTKFLRDDGVWANIPAQFGDDEFAIFDNVDSSKIAIFQASGISTSTTRTFTFPDKNGTLALLDDITALDLDGLSDVAISSPTSFQVLRYNGSSWVNANEDLDDLNNVIITAPTTKSFLAYDGSDWIDSEIQKGDLPIETVLLDQVQTFTSQKTFGASGISIVVSETANFNGDVNMGNASGDTITLNGFIDSDVKIEGGKIIKSDDSSEIGFLVSNDSGSPRS